MSYLRKSKKITVIHEPLSLNSENHLVPSSLCGPEATFFMALVIDLAPVNDTFLLIVRQKYKFTFLYNRWKNNNNNNKGSCERKTRHLPCHESKEFSIPLETIHVFSCRTKSWATSETWKPGRGNIAIRKCSVTKIIISIWVHMCILTWQTLVLYDKCQ